MSTGLVVAALLTTAFCLAVWGSLLRSLPPPLPPRVLLAAFLVALPLQPAAFYLVRLPFNQWLTGLLGHKPSLWIMIFYAPVTEELAKLIPLLVPAVRRAVAPQSAVRLALAIGLGFGIGELWFIAWNLREVPAVAALPFYMLGGFLGERFMVCLLHSAFTSLSLRWRGGLLLAMLAHLGLNLPIALAAVDFPPLGKAVWGVILGLWTALYFLAALFMLARLGGFSPGEMLLGRARCPGCGQEYPRPLLLGFNLGPRRYERCPHCRRWHMTSDKDLVRPGGDPPAREP